METVRKMVLLLLLCGVVTLVHAETMEQRLAWHHEFRVGWGDQLFETLVWHPKTIVVSADESRLFDYKENFTYYQHTFVEYNYRFNRWFSLGALVDLSGVSWDVVTRNGVGQIVDAEENEYFFNAVLMPTMQFTYLRHPYVNLYSGLGAGMCVNSGTETDLNGKHTVVAPAVNLTWLALSVNYERYFLSVEYGGMYALLNSNTIFLAKSRMITASFGVRF